MKKLFKDASIDGSGAFDLDNLAHLANFDFEENGDAGDAGKDSEDEEVDEETADAIKKALYLVKQVSFYCLLI